MLDKPIIVNLLRQWIAQRPGLEFGNYGDVTSYRAEMRSIARDRKEARELLRYVDLHDGITAESLQRAFSAFSGRLSIVGDHLEYCTGQYWPTEYRKAACAVLASAIWDYWRADVPKYGGERLEFLCKQEVENLGDYLRRKGAREFGRAMGARWFQ